MLRLNIYWLVCRFIGFLLGGNVDEDLWELFKECGDVLIMLLIIGGLVLYWLWFGDRDVGYWFG